MLESFKKTKYLLISLVVIILFTRIFNYDFPIFISDEARIAYRGFTLSHLGKDELGRSWPLVFNSQQDYHLPATSYLTALGVLLFGKNDFGARLPFVLLGFGIVYLTYKIAQTFKLKKDLSLLVCLILLFSPTLIFLSKIPNEAIVMTFFTALLFYFILTKKNIVFILLIIFLSLLVSKFTWLITIPFLIFSLIFYGNQFSRKSKITLSLISIVFVVTIVGFYLQVPQSTRSFKENIFPLFSNDTIKNGIDKSRGEGLKSGWPNILEVILFNKSDFLIISSLHWMSNLQPSILFAQFDKTGQLGFSQMGLLNKVLIIPFIWGIIYLIREGKRKERLLVVYFLLLTFPAIFIYPNLSPQLVVLILPFLALIIAFGFSKFNKVITVLILATMILEIGLNLLYLAPERKNTNSIRPNWIKTLTQDIYKKSLDQRIAVSDDIVPNILSYIEWYNPVSPETAYMDVPFPYKFTQSNIKSIKVIGSDNHLYECQTPEYDQVFISKRDKDKMKDMQTTVIKAYKDSLDQENAFYLQKSLCIK